MSRIQLEKGTWLDSESLYPQRKGKALYGDIPITVKVGLPDSIFSCPARTRSDSKTGRMRGFVYLENNVLLFSRDDKE